MSGILARPLTRLAIGVIASCAVLGVLSAVDDAEAFNCNHPTEGCPLKHNASSLYWSDQTSWPSGNQFQITLAGAVWDGESPLDFEKDGWCPCQAHFETAFDGISLPPATTYVTVNNGFVTYAYAVMNNSWTWYTDGTMSESNKQVDVRTIAVHEIGHWLWLGHECSVSSVMCPDYTTKWNLFSDDIDGINYLY